MHITRMLDKMDLVLSVHRTVITSPSHRVDGFVKDCSYSSALAIELLQFCTIAIDVHGNIWDLPADANFLLEDAIG